MTVDKRIPNRMPHEDPPEPHRIPPSPNEIPGAMPYNPPPGRAWPVDLAAVAQHANVTSDIVSAVITAIEAAGFRVTPKHGP